MYECMYVCLYIYIYIIIVIIIVIIMIVLSGGRCALTIEIRGGILSESYSPFPKWPAGGGAARARSLCVVSICMCTMCYQYTI